MSGPGDLLHSRIIELLPKLRRFARSLARNPHDADDLLQGALERALTHLEQWQADTRLDSLLYTLIKHSLIDQLRSRARRKPSFEDAGHVEDLPDHRGDAGGTLSVEQAMQCLPEDQRLAV